MDHRALYLAVASCFALTGCPDKAEPPKPKAAVAPVAAAPKPAEAPTAPPASSGPDAKSTAQVAQAKSGAAPAAFGPGCKKGNCKVEITVTGTPPNCTITANPDSLPVHKDNKGDDIKWTIAGNDYEFTDYGIEWKDPNAPFTGKAKNGNNFKWTDRNPENTPTPWKYNIEVQKKIGGAKCPIKDPTVINGVLV